MNNEYLGNIYLVKFCVEFFTKMLLVFDTRIPYLSNMPSISDMQILNNLNGLYLIIIEFNVTEIRRSCKELDKQKISIRVLFWAEYSLQRTCGSRTKYKAQRNLAQTKEHQQANWRFCVGHLALICFLAGHYVRLRHSHMYATALAPARLKATTGTWHRWLVTNGRFMKLRKTAH